MGLGKFWSLGTLFLLTILGSYVYAHHNSYDPEPTDNVSEQIQRLVFSSLQGEGEQIGSYLFAIKADGSERQNLTSNLKGVGSPLVWSSHGKKLAFIKDDSELYVVNSDGTELTNLYSLSFCKTPRSQVAWLANNQQVAFTRGCDGFTLEDPGFFAVYVSDLSNPEATKATEIDANSLQSDLYLSPDGTQVAFVQKGDIYSMNSDGTELTNLTNAPNDYSSGGSGLTWSPDGKRIAGYLGKYPQQQIYVLDTETKSLRNLTNNSDNEVYNVKLIWSPDGKKIAYYQGQSGDRLGNQQDIYLVDVATGDSVNVTNKPGEYHQLSWSPDGKYIAFSLGEYSGQDIYTLALDTGELRQLNQQAVVGVPAVSWSSDGEKVAFTREKDGNSILYVVNKNGEDLQQLTANSESVYFPTWQPYSNLK